MPLRVSVFVCVSVSVCVCVRACVSGGGQDEARSRERQIHKREEMQTLS